MTDRDRLIEILQDTLHEWECDVSIKTLTEITEHLIANGVIVPPCKFLQKCFVIPTIENNLSDITEMKCIGFSLSHDSYNANLITDKNKLYQPCFGAFGKTVFLTREEAEKALERSKRNETNI